MSFFRSEEPPNTSKRFKFLASTLKDAFYNRHSYHEESPDPSNKCKFLTSTLKDAFVDCRAFRGRISSSNPEEEQPDSDFDEEQEVFVSAIISKYMESKVKRKTSLAVDSFCWALSPTRGDISVTPKAIQQKGNDYKETEEFFSPHSRFSRCSSLTSLEAVASAMTKFSRSSSMSRIDFPIFQRRRLIIQELRHCEGWPFGLCKKALLLPPLPKSPSDSWSWHKSARVIKVHC